MLQSAVSFVFIFLMIAWLVWFAVLPLGIKREENPEEGNDHGAPKNPDLKRKFLLCAGVSLVLTCVLMYLIQNGSFEGLKTGAEQYLEKSN